MKPHHCHSCNQPLSGESFRRLGENILCPDCYSEFNDTLSQIQSEKIWETLKEESSYDFHLSLEETESHGIPSLSDSAILAQIGIEESGLVVLKGSQERHIGRMIQDANAQYTYLIQERENERNQGLIKSELKLMQLLMKGRYVSTENLVQAKVYQGKNKTSYVDSLHTLKILSYQDTATLLCEETGYIFSLRNKQQLSGSLENLFPLKMMRLFEIFPIIQEGNFLNLAMVNPLDGDLRDALSKILPLVINPIIVTKNCLNNTLKDLKTDS